MKLLSVTVALILLGLGIGYIDAIKSITLWSSFYYLWDKTKDLFLVLTLQQFIDNDRVKKGLRLLASFFVIRIIWDLIAITTDYNTAASPTVMIIMFSLWAALIITLMIQGATEEWQH